MRVVLKKLHNHGFLPQFNLNKLICISCNPPADVFAVFILHLELHINERATPIEG